jgi:hypothetical protein
VARRRKAEALAERPGPDGPAYPVQQAATADVLTDTDTALEVSGTSGTTLIGTDLQRHRVKMWLQWKALEPKLTHADAAARLGIAGQTLTNLLHKASKAGWLRFDDPLADLEYKQIPKANGVIDYHLDQGDKEVAVKLLQATAWKQYAASKGVSETPTTVLALKIEMPEGMLPQQGSTPIKGVIVGQPRTFDAEVVEVKSDE